MAKRRNKRFRRHWLAPLDQRQGGLANGHRELRAGKLHKARLHFLGSPLRLLFHNPFLLFVTHH
jgi:hypothetical protein